MSEAGKWSYSFDEETFHGSEIESVEGAIAEALSESEHGDGRRFWIGQCESPIQPEDMWNAADWLEHVSVQDDYSGDWAEDWDRSTKEQRKELEAEVRAVLAAWLDRHKLRPTHFKIDNDSVREFTVEVIDGVEPKAVEVVKKTKLPRGMRGPGDSDAYFGKELKVYADKSEDFNPGHIYLPSTDPNYYQPFVLLADRVGDVIGKPVTFRFLPGVAEFIAPDDAGIRSHVAVSMDMVTDSADDGEALSKQIAADLLSLLGPKRS